MRPCLLVPKLLLRKPLPLRFEYLFSPCYALFLPLMELIGPPWWRKKCLERSGVREGLAVLEEGFGSGTSPLLAARMVDPTGRVHAPDVAPIDVVLLWLRAKLYKLTNLEVILADAKHTGVPDSTIEYSSLTPFTNSRTRKER